MEKIGTFEYGDNELIVMRNKDNIEIGIVFNTGFVALRIFEIDKYLSDYDNLVNAIDLYKNGDTLVNVEQDKMDNYLVTELISCEEIFLQSAADKNSFLENLSLSNKETLLEGYNLYSIPLSIEYFPAS